jgi:hypothetical protein
MVEIRRQAAGGLHRAFYGVRAASAPMARRRFRTETLIGPIAQCVAERHAPTQQQQRIARDAGTLQR